MPLINEFNNEHEEWIVGDRYIFEIDDMDNDNRAEQVVIRNIETKKALVLQARETDLGWYVFVSTWALREETDKLGEPYKLMLTFFMKVRYDHMEDLLVMDGLRKISSIGDVEKYIDNIVECVGNLLPGVFKSLMELYLREVV
jgi:hypothetical protein